MQKSFDYFIQCKDNHKAWQASEWQSTLENPILLLISELTLNIGLRIYVNRVGERNNDYRSQAG